MLNLNTKSPNILRFMEKTSCAYPHKKKRVLFLEGRIHKHDCGPACFVVGCKVFIFYVQKIILNEQVFQSCDNLFNRCFDIIYCILPHRLQLFRCGLRRNRVRYIAELVLTKQVKAKLHIRSC